MEITGETFNLLKNNGKPLVIDFWASWCGPCRQIAPTIDELAKEYESKVTIGKCNVEDETELATKFAVRNIPTILLFKRGVVVDKIIGAAAKQAIQEKIEKLL